MTDRLDERAAIVAEGQNARASFPVHIRVSEAALDEMRKIDLRRARALRSNTIFD